MKHIQILVGVFMECPIFLEIEYKNGTDLIKKQAEIVDAFKKLIVFPNIAKSKK